MGSVLSSFYGAGEAQAAEGEAQGPSSVKTFHDTAGWNSNFAVHKSQPNQLVGFPNLYLFD